MQVISLTKGKICKEYLNGQEVIVKHSSFNEVQKIEEARKIFKNHKIEINGVNFNFHLPKIYDYNDNKIYMEFLEGDNLEICLRTCSNRSHSVKIINSLFQYLYDNKIYWGDFAPRNIIIDYPKRNINLCDFEKGIRNNITGKEYLQNYVYEEYAAFLLPKERNFTCTLNDIFSVDEQYPIKLDNIHSKRIKNIIQELQIPENTLTNQTIANITKMIITAETPYCINGNYIFPIINLEQIKDHSYELFAKKICHHILSNRKAFLWKKQNCLNR